MTDTRIIINELQIRRRKLGLPYKVLAKRANLSMVTVQRVLNGDTGVRFDNIAAIADCLGIDLLANNTLDVDTILERQARQKAKRLVAMAQGTAGLEGQGVSEEVCKQAEKKLVHELIAGDKRALWEA